MLSKRVVVVAAVVFVALAGAVLTGCGGNGAPDFFPMTVNLTPANTFDPGTVNVSPGNVVEFTNTDTTPHTVITDAGVVAPNGPNSDILFPNGIPAGGKYDWTVPGGISAGTTWYYHDRLHGVAGNGTQLGTGMVGLAVAF